MKDDMRKRITVDNDPLAGLIEYEDEGVLVVNKPQGMLTSSGPKDKRPTLWKTVRARAMAAGHQQQMGIIHRLDRDASGLLVFSKNDNAYQSLKKQFFQHTVDRVYMAVVKGTPRPTAGTLKNKLTEWKNGTVHPAQKGGEEAITYYETCEVFSGCSLVRVKLETGRKHQIRVHMAGIGCPIVGDAFYNPDAKEDDKLMLCAVKLCFDHPLTGQRMKFEVDLPAPMREAIRNAKARVGKGG